MFDYFGYPYDNINDGCECMIRSLLASNADIVILPIQDILKYGADTRMNTPGVAEGNWAYRVKREQLSEIDRGKYKYWNSLYFRDNK